MLEVYNSLALGCMSVGVLVLLITFLSTGDLLLGVPLALDFWMAGGFMKLTGSPTWATIATAALLVIIRKIVVKTMIPSRTNRIERSSGSQGSL